MGTPGITGAAAPRTVSELVGVAAGQLGSVPQARWIVAHVTEMRVGELMGVPERVVGPAEIAAVEALVGRCRAGEPIQYVLGTWSFRRLELDVDRRVLIPRPETEVVVDAALEELRSFGAPAPGSELLAVDLGAGSGAIALSLAAEFAPGSPLTVWATDLCEDALAVLRHNRAKLAQRDGPAARRVHVAAGDWFAALPGDLAGTVALVASNPPYVSEEEWAGLDPSVRDHEPKAALVPGPGGYEALDRLLGEAGRWLAPGGSLVLEMAPSQVPEARDRAATLGYERVSCRADLAGRARILVARAPS